MKYVTNTVTEITVFSPCYNNSSNVKDDKIIHTQWIAGKVVDLKPMAR